MAHAVDTNRCSGCGKPLEQGLDGKPAKPSDDYVRIAQGRVKNGRFSEGKPWGVLHGTCFNRSIDSPDAVLEEVRRQARRVA
jgi:hypothetical protein